MRFAPLCATLTTAAVAALACTAVAHADGEKLAFTGGGSGTGHCFKYQMHVEMTLQGDKVVGTLQQKGRSLYKFSLAKDASGKFAGDVPISNGNKLALTGTAAPDGGSIKMTGYCNFSGKLAAQ
jgi:hypothetical protein